MASPNPYRDQLQAGDLTGAKIGRFLVTSRLGAGGFGEVYRAEDTRLKRPVALKRLSADLRSDPRYHHRFLHEAERASALNHQHIAGVYDVLEAEGELFLVMEYVSGATLRQRMREKLAPQQALDVTLQAAEAVAAAHERGIIHCDLKPENLMLTFDGQVKVLDFGVAKRLPVAAEASAITQSLETQPGALGGTVAYMAPEVLLGQEPTPAADVFALGVILYELLTGKHPFLAGTALATANRILNEAPVLLGLPATEHGPDLHPVLARALAKDPRQRHPDAGVLLAELQTLKTRPTAPESRPPRRHLYLPLLVALVVVVALGAVLIRSRFASRPAAPGASVSLAVLPFRAIGSQDEDKAYCDGLTQTLTSKLSQLPAHLLVVAPASEVHTNQVTTVEAARKRLGVTLVLAGSCRGAGAGQRINYEMIDASSRRILRAGTTTAPALDPFLAEDEVVDSVVTMLNLELNPEQHQALLARGTTVPGAHEVYTRGRGYLQDVEKPESLRLATESFQRALELDPRYARAHAGLGEAYWRTFEQSKKSEWVGKARDACRRALEIDASLAEAHICLGTLYTGTGEYEKAEEQFRGVLQREPASHEGLIGLARAYDGLRRFADVERIYREVIELKPNYWAGYAGLAAFYYHQARYPEAAEQFERAAALAPGNIRVYKNLGGVYISMGRYEDAIRALKIAIELQPNAGSYSNLGVAYFNLRRFDDAIAAFEQACSLAEFYIYCGNLARAYYWAGRRDEAVRHYRRSIELAQAQLKVNPEDDDANISLAYFHAMLGSRQQAYRYLDRSLGQSDDGPEALFYAAMVYSQFGQRSQALAWLRKAVARGYSIADIRAAPEFQALSADPGFQALVQASQK